MSASPDTLPIFKPQPVEADSLAALRRLIQQVNQLSTAVVEARPFLLLTPLGMGQREALQRMLDADGIHAGRIFHIDDYPRLSSVLYSRSVDNDRLRVALAFEQLWRTVCPDMRAECWEIPDLREYTTLLQNKSASRERLGTRRFRLSTPDVTLRSPGQVIRLQAFHVPDEGQWEREARLLQAWLRVR